jgi:hypothetical protein
MNTPNDHQRTTNLRMPLAWLLALGWVLAGSELARAAAS